MEKKKKPKRILSDLSPDVIQLIRQYSVVEKIKQADIAGMIGIPRTTFQDILYGGKTSPENIQKIEKFLEEKGLVVNIDPKRVSDVMASMERPSFLGDTQEKVKGVKYLLLALELSLRHFKNSKPARDIFRIALDGRDVGYIASLLTALTDEEQMERWSQYSSHKFNFFGKKGASNGKRSDA